MRTALQSYVDMFLSDQVGPVSGLCGRIIRGKKPEDFLTLTDDPTRKLVMLMGPDGLEKLLGKSGYEMLLAIGYEPEYLEHKVAEGNRFKLVIFPEGGAAKLATWDNVVEIVSGVYPDVAMKLARNLAAMKSRNFAEIEEESGFRFLDVEKAGKNDPRFMTYERFRTARGDLWEARAFLYFTVHLRELYSGDGYTYDAKGNRGMMEYIVPNKPLADLGDHRVVNIDVYVPPKQTGGIMSTSKFALPIPAHFDPRKTEEVFRVNYLKLAVEAEAWAKKNKISPAAKDKLRICLMVIDDQNTFCLPDFELYVGGRSGRGAIEDNVRLAEFIYRYLGVITEIDPTMDTHTAMQIFHPLFWVNDAGEHPAPATMISLKDVESGVWKVNPGVAMSVARGNYMGLATYALHYVKKLTDGGKYPLMVWPYHAMLGGIGHALVSTVEEALFFHNVARLSQTGFEIKGGNPLTENYSVLRPEVLEGTDGRPIAQKNTRFIEKLMRYDVVIIAGQAKSHCVAWTIDDLLTEIAAKDPALAKKVYLMEDCTSPVVIPGVIDFTDMADAAFERFAKAGMHVVKSTDPIESWPDINL